MSFMLGYRFLSLEEKNPNNRHFGKTHQKIEIGDSKSDDADLIRHLVFKNKHILEKKFEAKSKNLANYEESVQVESDNKKNLILL